MTAAAAWTDEQDDERECESCGDLVAYLSTDDLCDGCAALEECPECRERFEPDDLNRWPGLTPPVVMCSSCTHNARRSGWEPGG